MDYYEDVWVDPVTGTILDQKYSIQIYVPTIFDTRFHDENGLPSLAAIGFNGAMLRDIVANYTQEAQDEAASSAKRQALAQYYQGNEVIVLILNGAYTDKTIDDQISSQIESVDALTFGSKTLPSILIGGALILLLAGFYVYYQTGGGAASLDSMAADEGPSAEATESTDEPEEESDSGEEKTEDDDRREMAIPQEDSSDGESDAEEKE
jgi:hypothetical protein